MIRMTALHQQDGDKIRRGCQLRHEMRRRTQKQREFSVLAGKQSRGRSRRQMAIQYDTLRGARSHGDFSIFWGLRRRSAVAVGADTSFRLQ